MKFNSILAVVGITLATKVSAECFANKLGYPCCTQTNEIVSIDENGKWGLENGQICGIEEINNSLPVITDDNIWLQRRSTNWKGYMDKVKPTEFCPPEYLEMKEGVEYPKVENITYYSTTTESKRPLIVVLPPNYSKSKKYPVLYLLHGIMTDGSFMLQEGFGTITIPGNLIHEHKAKELIMVLPNQYAPAPGTEVEPALNEKYFAGYNNFINDLINDIMPYMKKNYSIATGKENTAIAGYSFGGRNSLYIALQRPDLFGFVGAFSPAPGLLPADDIFSGHHIGLYQEEKEIHYTGEAPYLTMISCGTNDTVVGTFPESYHNAFAKNNEDHVWYQITGADHIDNVSVTSPVYNFIKSIFGQLNEEKNKPGKSTIKKTIKTKTKKTKSVKKTKTKKVVKNTVIKKVKKTKTNSKGAKSN
ncbi:alpha/beta-hydrolase [Neocallimastix sp. 'constans']|jgi:enterochelin esterase-like enzyme